MIASPGSPVVVFRLFAYPTTRQTTLLHVSCSQTFLPTLCKNHRKETVMPVHFMIQAWPVGKVILGIAAFIILSGWSCMLAVSLLRIRQMLAKPQGQAQVEESGESRKSSCQPSAAWRVQEPAELHAGLIQTMTVDGVHYTPIS